MFEFVFEKSSKQSWKSEFQHLTRYKLTKERSLDPCEEGPEPQLFRPSLLLTVGGRGTRFSLLGDQPPKTSRVQTIFQGILFVTPSLWWKFIVRFEIMTFSDQSFLWVYLSGRKFTKARTYTKRCFIRYDIWEKKGMKEVRSSSGSICCVCPSVRCTSWKKNITK